MLAREVLYCVALMILTIACSNSETERFVEWVQDYDNGLHVRKDVNEFVFDLQYQPIEYLKIIQSNESQHVSDYPIQHYLLTISLQDDSQNIVDYQCHSPEEIQKKLYYFSYQFQYDIYLEEDGKNIPCVLYHFESATDLKRERKFLLGFERPVNDSKEARLVIQSHLFDSVPIRIKILKNKFSS